MIKLEINPNNDELRNALDDSTEDTLRLIDPVVPDGYRLAFIEDEKYLLLLHEDEIRELWEQFKFTSVYTKGVTYGSFTEEILEPFHNFTISKRDDIKDGSMYFDDFLNFIYILNKKDQFRFCTIEEITTLRHSGVFTSNSKITYATSSRSVYGYYSIQITTTEGFGSFSVFNTATSNELPRNFVLIKGTLHDDTIEVIVAKSEEKENLLGRINRDGEEIGEKFILEYNKEDNNYAIKETR